MNDLIPCTSCQVLLRAPDGAERIRCPQCKSEIQLKAPAPKPAKAIPLPFDQPKMATALPTLPTAKPLSPTKAIIRGKVLPDDEPARKNRTQKLSRKQQIEEELKADKNFEQIDFECRNGRIGLRLLSLAAGSSTANSLCYAIFLASLVIAQFPEPTTLFISVLGLGSHGLFLLLGYGFCCAGPRGMRGTAAMGMIVTLLHAALIVPLVIFGFAAMAKHIKQENSDRMLIAHVVFVMSSSVNNLDAPTDFPWMIQRGAFVREEWRFVLMMLLGGTLEFAKMAILGTLVQYYASEGKSHELGFKSLKFVYRIVWVIGVVAAVKLIFLILFILFGGEESVREYFYIPQALLTVAFFLWWAFAWYGEYLVMTETIDVVTPARFLDRRAVLDDYY